MEEESKDVILTKPYFSSEGDSLENYRPPNLMKRIFSLFRNVRIGSDFTSMQLPAHFNVPKSQLQSYGETVYGVRDEILGKCNREESSVERLIAVIAWNLSTFQPLPFGTAPFNPTLGETHHVSRGSLNILLEQISHKPPVTALHATDEEENLEILWCQNAIAKFYGTSVELVVHGKRQLKLLNHGETYFMQSPKFLVKFLPLPGLEFIGTLRTRCLETRLEAELNYSTTSFFGNNPRTIKGKIFDSASSKTLFTIDGHWDKIVNVTDLDNGQTRVLYNAKEVTSRLKTPIVKNSKEIWETESASVWSEVSKRILNRDWRGATEAKKAIEENQRKLLRERKLRGQTLTPSKHFDVTYTKEVGWDCSPKQRLVPPAPIVVP